MKTLRANREISVIYDDEGQKTFNVCLGFLFDDLYLRSTEICTPIHRLGGTGSITLGTELFYSPSVSWRGYCRSCSEASFPQSILRLFVPSSPFDPGDALIAWLLSEDGLSTTWPQIITNAVHSSVRETRYALKSNTLTNSWALTASKQRGVIFESD